jgi:hypothetical protein
MLQKRKPKVPPILVSIAAVIVLILVLIGFGMHAEKPDRLNAGRGQGHSVKALNLCIARTSGEAFYEQPFLVDPKTPLTEQIRDVLQALGKVSAGRSETESWPFPLRVRSLFLEPDGLLILDLEKPLAYNQRGGAYAEWLMLRSILHTIHADFALVYQVHILINGHEQESLAGHLDIADPFAAKAF